MSKPNLVELGSGTLQIDAITGNCTFQGKQIDQLGIAEEIRAWMRDDLRANDIPADTLIDARLSVKLSFSIVPWSAPKQEVFYTEGKTLQTEKMNRCVIECESHVTTDEDVYPSQLTEVQEWPVGWPETSVGRS